MSDDDLRTAERRCGIGLGPQNTDLTTDATTNNADTIKFGTGATTTTSKRPDPPDLDGARCEVGGCLEPATATCWSHEYDTWFRFCDIHVETKTAKFDDLEVVD